MIPLHLTHLRTSDRVRLEGAVVLPKRKGDTALIWIHGLGSRFSSGQTILHELSRACQRHGIAYFKFNNRGHDFVNKDVNPHTKNFGVGTSPFGGSGFEHFEDCIKDIRAIIRFAKKLGYKKIILAGHSTGANKVLYYMYKTRDRAVKALALVAPISDIAGKLKELAARPDGRGARKFNHGLSTALKLYSKNPEQLMPAEYGILTARRYLSLYEIGWAEDTFPYHNLKARWKELRSVKIPVAVIVGSRDEYLDRLARKLTEIFRKHAVSTKNFSGVIIKGAKHGFRRKEKELSIAILGWIKTL